jgi:hypothetical protein
LLLIDDLALIGGLDRPMPAEDFRDVVCAVADAGFKPAMCRVKTGLDNLRLLPIPPRRR